eukprot:UN30473
MNQNLTTANTTTKKAQPPPPLFNEKYLSTANFQPDLSDLKLLNAEYMANKDLPIKSNGQYSPVVKASNSYSPDPTTNNSQQQLLETFPPLPYHHPEPENPAHNFELAPAPAGLDRDGFRTHP